MFLRKKVKVTVIITDDIQLPENIISLIDGKKYHDMDNPCLWNGINNSFKIKDKDFNAKVFYDNKASITNQNIMRADPVFIQAGLNGAMVVDNKPAELSLKQAQEIGAAIKSDLDDYGLELTIGTPYRWYIHADNIPKFEAPPTACAKEQILKPNRNNEYLDRLSNQLQITLHNLPINQERFEQGLTEINSLWFWGVCDLSSKKIKAKARQTLFADDEEIMLYAKYFGIKLEPLSSIKSNLSNGLIVINDDVDPDIWQAINNIQHKSLSFNYRGICYQ